MKKYILYLVSAVLLGGSFTSCHMLDEESFGNPTANELLKDPANVARMVGQVYADIKWLHDHWGYWGITELSTDECINPVRQPGNDWSDDGYWKNFNTMDWGPTDLSFEFVWNYSMKGAALCNTIKEQISEAKDVMGEDVYNQYVAELIVVRSYYYYTLFDAFGRIPYSANFGETTTDKDLMDAPQVWEHLVTDLEENADKLPAVNDDNRAENYGRATQGFAYGLLSRLYLNALSFGVDPGVNVDKKFGTSADDYYKKCIEYCDKIIDAGSYSTSTSFFDNFLVNNENSRENIFVIVENGYSNVDYQDVAGKMANKLRIVMLTLNYRHQDSWDLLEKPWNGFCAPASFISLYQPGDIRGLCDGSEATGGTKIDFTKEENKRGWFIGPCWDVTGDSCYAMSDKLNKEDDNKPFKALIVNGVSSLTDCKPNEGARCMKYEVEQGTRTAKTHKYCENDFVLMRYGEILFNKYEAALRCGDATAKSDVAGSADFQRMQTRVGVPVFTGDLDEVIDERGREFYWEMLRRRDLIRFGKFAAGTWDFKEVRDEHFNWFPIPSKILETSPKWTQNKGYTE